MVPPGAVTNRLLQPFLIFLRKVAYRFEHHQLCPREHAVIKKKSTFVHSSKTPPAQCAAIGLYASLLGVEGCTEIEGVPSWTSEPFRL